MTTKYIIVYISMVAAIINCHHLNAQDFGIEYTSELQTDFNKGTNWVNLLRMDLSLPIREYLKIDIATISTAKTREERLVNDLQTFSNIEEENIPLALAILGFEFSYSKSSFFIGIRNLNEDYFASPCTSLFTNSSCGIFPTLSANYPIANYPVSSVGIDYKLELNHWNLETSLYNGTGYKNFTGRENVFRFCQKTDGLLSITSINYQKNDNGYYCGLALHSGLPVDNEDGNKEKMEKTKEKELNTIFWGYIEQHLSRNINILIQYSVNPTEKKGCRSYSGIGLLFHIKNTTGGIFTDYADFTDKYELASELTWKIPCYKNGYIQPTLHFIKSDQNRYVIGMLRFGYKI